MKITKVDKDMWAEVSGTFHEAVFGDKFDDGQERVDFGLLASTHADKLIGYATCREEDSRVVYMQYGGALPEARQTTNVWYAYNQLVKYLAERYPTITTRIENTNKPMIRMAMRVGFLITGVRMWDGKVLLELQRRN